MADLPTPRTNILNEAVVTPKSPFRNAAGLLQRIASVAEQCQKLENAMHQVEIYFTIDQGFGWTLDIVGKWMNIERQGLNDTDYKALLRATARARRSLGRVEDFYETLVLLDERAWAVFDLHPMSWHIQADGAWGAISPEIVLQVLDMVKDGGSERAFTYGDFDDDNALMTASGDVIEYSDNGGAANDAGTIGGQISEYVR